MVMLTFNDLDTESDYDYVYLYDGSSESDPMIIDYTGSYRALLPTWMTSQRYMFIRFTSDTSFASRGFDAIYTSVPPTTSKCCDLSAWYLLPTGKRDRHVLHIARQH
jgi:CUB domain